MNTEHAVATGSRQPALIHDAYPDLRRIAQTLMAHERPGHTLSATSLVHEAYLRLFEQDEARWDQKEHFCALASIMMRRVLHDHARRRNRQKRGGWDSSMSRCDQEVLVSVDDDTTVQLVSEVMERLRALDERQFMVVHLRIFGGCSALQAAHAMGISLRTVEREWKAGKAWLKRELRRGECR